MEIRSAGPGDAGAIADLHVRSSEAAYAHLPPSVLSRTPEDRRLQWSATLGEADAQVWVAEVGGTIVGFCHLRIFTPETAEIATLYIDPAHWRERIGRALLECARQEAEKGGCTRLSLRVYQENHRARAAYEAVGFTAEPGTIVHERTGLLLMEYTMPIGGTAERG